MSLARAWTRRICGMSFFALLVPGAIVGSLVVLAAAGGLGRLGEIGQVYDGPSIPTVPAAYAAPGTHPAAHGRLAPSAPAAGGAPASGGVSAGARTDIVSPAPARASGTGSGGSGGAIAHPGGGGRIAPGGSGAGPGDGRLPGPPARTPRPVAHPTLTDRVIGSATPITRRIPGPAGKAATGALDTAGAVADTLLPGNGNGTGGVRRHGSSPGGLP